jgi:hypothetical protein
MLIPAGNKKGLDEEIGWRLVGVFNVAIEIASSSCY